MLMKVRSTFRTMIFSPSVDDGIYRLHHCGQKRHNHSTGGRADSVLATYTLYSIKAAAAADFSLLMRRLQLNLPHEFFPSLPLTASAPHSIRNLWHCECNVAFCAVRPLQNS